jgi:hypothetical protein
MIGACSVLMLSACATKPLSSAPLHFYVSCNGPEESACAIAYDVNALLKKQPGFLRNFTEATYVHVADGSPLADGRYRYRVLIKLPSRIADRRIREKDRKLAEFEVTCGPDRPQPCVDPIMARTMSQVPRIRRIVARSPSV